MSNASATGATSTSAATAVTRTDLERMDASSDSAVSSMGSERVPSLSDGEWGDGGKIRPFDYSYTSRQHNNGIGSTENVRMPPVAQKKHQMYGKRYFQEHNSPGASHPSTPVKYEYREPSSTPYNIPSQTEGAVGPKVPEMKYCSMDFGHVPRNPADHIQHNHTYHLPVESSGSLNVPITVDDIINLPMDEFNERLSKYDLSETQLSLIRDIRRRGKNKVAAQNCRKRKLDQILSLADEVKEMKDRKMRLISDHEYLKNE
ncbi:unnamed protein product [Phaedon cochleariae]|uniref:BZIP domain-containing protein n=1 Tax=Phaedon cochleariae TaxID=80249 RepID=A0A9N9SEI8_PHACE|nr:unnamed protein product [Phaedon cochleariae]